MSLTFQAISSIVIMVLIYIGIHLVLGELKQIKDELSLLTRGEK